MAIVRAETFGENMTDQSAICERVRGFILQKFPLARRRGLKDSDRLLEEGIIDSLGVLDLVAFLESEFSIQVLDEELLPENFRSIEGIAGFIERKSKSVHG
jgi:acyl carrier protein